jgi:hypothetical protein
VGEVGSSGFDSIGIEGRGKEPGTGGRSLSSLSAVDEEDDIDCGENIVVARS